MIQFKILVKNLIETMNESNDYMWNLSAKTFCNLKRLHFEDDSHKFDHYITFNTYRDMYMFLKGMQKGANSLKPF